MFVAMLLAACATDVAPDAGFHIPHRVDRAVIQRLGRELEGEPARQIVAVIVLDTVRADHLEIYGYPTATMPQLAAWAQGAQVHEQARSPSSWTLPSHASLFTQMMPREHGARGMRPTSSAPRPAHSMSRSADTLAERFHQGGWATVGVVANQAFLSESFGVARGFDHWLNHEFQTTGPPYPDAQRVTDVSLRLLELPWDKPLFLFINYMDAHHPLTQQWDGITDAEKLWFPGEISYEALVPRMMAGQLEAPERALKVWNRAYDAELTYMDGHLGRLLAELEARGAWVAVTSDHGEFLGEHGLMEHSKDLYDEVLHVPLMVKGPGVEPGRSPAPVMMYEAGAWALEHAGLPPLQPAFVNPPGVQVAELYWTRKKDLQDPRYGERLDRCRRLFVENGKALLLSDRDPFEAYDLREDPGMTQSLDESDWLESLTGTAQTWGAEMQDHDGVKPWKYPTLSE